MSKKSNNNVHVSRNSNREWQAKVEGNARASVVTGTQKEAIAEGRKIAQREKSELVIHGEDGRIREKNSYGNDPNPPKG
ncbi:MAG: DUF2188 domain-containing protein [Polyangiaceae bacterium]|nr:DUF2188 domain-containing protein [Polyangiaceae bacterium]